MLSEKLLKQVAEELALAMNESLPKPEECQHQFSETFESKMQLINCNEGCPIWSAFSLWIHNSRTVKITM